MWPVLDAVQVVGGAIMSIIVWRLVNVGLTVTGTEDFIKQFMWGFLLFKT